MSFFMGVVVAGRENPVYQQVHVGRINKKYNNIHATKFI